MEHIKLQDSISTEELIKLAVSSDEPIEYEPYNTAVLFCKDLNLQEGESEIPSSIVYETYRQWETGELQSRTVFFTDFGKIFKKVKTRKFQCYKLDATPFDLSDEAIRRAVDNYDKERQKAAKRKKRNKKK